jgi:hypothetical protein
MESLSLEIKRQDNFQVVLESVFISFKVCTQSDIWQFRKCMVCYRQSIFNKPPKQSLNWPSSAWSLSNPTSSSTETKKILEFWCLFAVGIKCLHLDKFQLCMSETQPASDYIQQLRISVGLMNNTWIFLAALGPF